MPDHLERLVIDQPPSPLDPFHVLTVSEREAMERLLDSETIPRPQVLAPATWQTVTSTRDALRTAARTRQREERRSNPLSTPVEGRYPYWRCDICRAIASYVVIRAPRRSPLAPLSLVCETHARRRFRWPSFEFVTSWNLGVCGGGDASYTHLSLRDGFVRRDCSVCAQNTTTSRLLSVR